MSNTVVITKSPAAVIGPSDQAMDTSDIISLSSYDKMYLSNSGPVHLFCVFEHPIDEPVEAIKRGLSKALTYYYPIAGRLAPGAGGGGGGGGGGDDDDDDDQVVIKCTGEGVTFVAASANCAVQDVGTRMFSDPSLQEDLAVFYPANGFSYSEPLLLMQVTVFTCGGFVMGITWNHAVGDGCGLAQFLQAVSELARGLPSPSVLPVSRSKDSLMFSVPPSFSTHFMLLMASLQPSPLAFLDITILPSLIHHIQDRSLLLHGRKCRVFEAVAAVLWRCRTRAIMSDPKALAVLYFVANARRHAGAKKGYYGNCVTMQLARATSGAVANADVMDLVKMIQCAKARLPDQSDMDELLLQQPHCLGYNLLGMSCWRNIGLQVPDFGAGRPARVTCYWQEQDRTTLPFCIPCIPCKDDHNVLSICVREEHAGAFRQELALMHRIIHNPAASSKL